jgi:hypothetical protein
MPIYHFRKDGLESAFFFVHIPKTGGTAIESYFRSLGLSGFFDPYSYMQIRRILRVPPAHYDYEVCDRLFRLDRMYSFAIVRDPIDRMISEYRWAIERSSISSSLKKLSFSEFLRYALGKYRQDEDFLAGHLKPQSCFVGKRITRVFRYEDGLNKIVTEVLRDVGIPSVGDVNVPKVNTSGRAPVVLSDDDVAFIHETYADDYRKFGYK